MERLTPKQMRFVEEYLIDLNATRAAARAGYAEKTAHVQGPRLLGNVRVAAAISEAKAARRERIEIDQDAVVREIANLLSYDPRDVISWGPQGFNIKDSRELTPDQAKVVHSVSESPSQWGWRRSVKFYDRLKAAELLGRHLGLFTEKIELGGPGSGPIEVVEIQEVKRADR
jgi:phage terminase small subunit